MSTLPPHGNIFVHLDWDEGLSAYTLPHWLDWGFVEQSPMFLNPDSFRKFDESGIPYPAILCPRSDAQDARCSFCTVVIKATSKWGVRPKWLNHIRTFHGINAAHIRGNPGLPNGKKWSPTKTAQLPGYPGWSIITFDAPRLPSEFVAQTTNMDYCFEDIPPRPSPRGA